jgi:alkanesulfonate monooxygenase SsuD/methylene tetrahydromethanopterin reductase-like flavin-dependent oxidoreductase (luciferase family)
VAEWLQEKEEDLGTYDYAGDAKKLDDDGMLDLLTYDFIRDSGSAVVGDPERCLEMAKRYEAVGVDLLLCLVNPYKIGHEQVLQTIELMGEHVIPQFD